MAQPTTKSIHLFYLGGNSIRACEASCIGVMSIREAARRKARPVAQLLITGAIVVALAYVLW